MEDTEHLRELLAQVIILGKKHGPKSDELKHYYQQHSNVVPDFKELAAALILLMVKFPPEELEE